ncbi:hypothetical protein NDU88_003009 [Pleurodeles waltl]|uniref:Uncharacterized protein n=1 Tax=Pleurodeles waltl TaxID=8319 RepID=A0AAV7NNH9_PLEWA|nr:hypothetical protein NDU88_003009 [Pleurodeles waltl]
MCLHRVLLNRLHVLSTTRLRATTANFFKKKKRRGVAKLHLILDVAISCIRDPFTPGVLWQPSRVFSLSSAHSCDVELVPKRESEGGGAAGEECASWFVL